MDYRERRLEELARWSIVGEEAERRIAEEIAEGKDKPQVVTIRTRGKGDHFLPMASQMNKLIGSAVKTECGWLHIQQIARHCRAVGVYVTKKKATELNVVWQKATKIAELEQALKTLHNSDFGSPEELRDIEAKLKAAKESAADAN